jgi:hypothetical protein
MPCCSHLIRRAALAGATGFAFLASTGCHSAYIEATVKNASGAPVSLVEVDYPSASFGREMLAPDAEYHYRFKVLGNGPTKVLWTDAAHKDHATPGPVLHEGDEGRLTITLGPAAANWTLALVKR